MKTLLTYLLISLVIIGVFGCAATSSKTPKTPEPPQMLTMSCVIPVLEPVDGFPWEQVRDNVTIKLTPEQFVHKAVYERSVEEKPLLFTIGDQKKYIVTERPAHFAVKPKTMQLHLHIVNNLPNVLRFHGCVLSFKADGKSLPIDETTQAELTRAVLTPYADLDITLQGPGADALSEINMLSFAIYDVITEVDAANNPTKRTTFEWMFSIRPQNIREELPIIVKEQKMTPAKAASLDRYFIKE